MPACTPSLAKTRPALLAALSGAALLASWFSSAHAEPAMNTPTEAARTSPEDSATKAETLEERIAGLHTALQITPAEEADWARVAQTMRDNSAAIEKLPDQRTADAAKTESAVSDLEAYERFAEAHVAGLKNLIASFTTLYQSMPAAQQKLADEVFENFGHKAADPTRG